MELLGKNAKIRFQVQDGNDAYSDYWSAFVRAEDVYLAAASTGGVSKVSLHKSGICRYAITENLASHRPPVGGDRLISRWKRGSEIGVEQTQVLALNFIPFTPWAGSGFTIKSGAVRLPYPVFGGSTQVAVFYSQTNPLDWHSTYWLRSQLLGVWQLNDNLFVSLRKRMAPLDNARMDLLRATIDDPPQRMIVGEENPAIWGAGHYDCIIAETTENHCYLNCLMAVPNKLPGLTTGWWTKTGNRKQV